jgi:subtilisin
LTPFPERDLPVRWAIVRASGGRIQRVITLVVVLCAAMATVSTISVAPAAATTAATTATAAPLPAAPPSPRRVPVPAAITEAIATHGEAKVIVELADAPPDWLPLGLSAAPTVSAASRVLGALPAAAHHDDRTFRSVPLAGTTVDAAGLEQLATSPLVAHLAIDELSRADLVQSAPMVEAPTVWANGFNGAGQTVVILDTGVDRTHPFLGGRVVDGACFSSTYAAFATTAVCPGADPKRAYGLTTSGPCPIPNGECDHGTHVAGIAAGGTGTSGSGIAWGANIISFQVFSRVDDNALCGGAPPCALTYNTDQIAAMDYLNTTLRFTYNVAGVNMSLGGGLKTTNCDTDGRKPIIDALRSHGIPVIIAAGNNGIKNAISPPACISSAISVGATLDTGATVSSYSNSASFLTILAPGSNITSSIPGGGFATWNGTSMATPHVLGAFALIRQAVPGVSIDDTVTALQATGTPITDTNLITKKRILIQKAITALTGPPQIQSVAPNTGDVNGGTAVVLNGTGFTGATAVSFGGVPATSFTVSSFGQLTAVAPPHPAPGWLSISVTTPKGTSANVLSSWFQYQLQTFTVASTVDAVDTSPGDGLCRTAALTCSLRAAVQETNALPGLQAIALGSNTTYPLSIAGVGEDASVAGDLDITGDLTLTGPGTIDAGNLDRAFDVHGGTVGFTNVTITHGQTTDWGGGVYARAGTVTLTGATVTANQAQVGGGVAVAAPATGVVKSASVLSSNGAMFGGGVAAAGSLTLTATTVTANASTSLGAGVLATGVLSIDASTISSNTTPSLGGGILGLGSSTINASTVTGNQALAGGGIMIGGTGSITRSTISGNTAVSGGGAGGLLNTGTLTLSTSTVSGNSAPFGGGVFNGGTTYGWNGALTIVDTTITANSGGGLGNDAGVATTVTNSVIGAQTTGTDCAGTMTTGGFNLASDASCAWAAGGDVQSTNPLLAGLGWNGGPVFTHLPQAGSPAINTGKPGCSGTDARGAVRPHNGACDKGSVEV